MKYLFPLIALFVGLAVLCLLGGLFASLFIESPLIPLLYALAGACFVAATVLAVVGFIKTKNKKE